MTRPIMRAALLILALAGATAAAGCDRTTTERAREEARETAGTAGAKARELGQEVAQRTEAAAEQARQEAAEGTITGKIKAKMALDDTIRARDIGVETEGTVVTLTGTVETEAQRDRALQLARETDGVTRVVDKLQLRR